MTENFSRKDAKKIQARLCVSLFLLLSLTLPGFTQRKQSSARFDPDGSFWIHGTPPPEFSDFDSINLNAKRLWYLNAPGLMMRNTRYRYKTLTVKRDNFTFTTMTVRGIFYTFSGKFLKGGVYGAGNLDEETPVLEGTLTRFRNGKKVAEANLKFVYFGGT